MKLVVADTNAFLRFIINDIPEQVEKFEKLLQKAKKSEIILIIPQIIIFEINFILAKYYHLPKEDIAKKLQLIVRTPYFEIQDVEIFRNSIKLYSESNLSLPDCFIYCFAKEREAEIFSFDQKLLSKI